MIVFKTAASAAIDIGYKTDRSGVYYTISSIVVSTTITIPYTDFMEDRWIQQRS